MREKQYLRICINLSGMAASRFLRALNRMTSPCRDIDCSRGAVLRDDILFYLVLGLID